MLTIEVDIIMNYERQFSFSVCNHLEDTPLVIEMKTQSDNDNEYLPELESDTGSDVDESLVDSESESEWQTDDGDESDVLSSDEEDDEHDEPRLTSRQYKKKYRSFLTSIHPELSKKRNQHSARNRISQV